MTYANAVLSGDNIFYRLRSRLSFDRTLWNAEKHFLPPAVVAQLIDASKGKLFEITFLKRGDNTPRVMRARTGVSKWAREYAEARALEGKIVKPQPYEPREYGLVRVADMDKLAYRMISTESVTRFKIAGLIFEPTREGVWGFKMSRAPKRRHSRTRNHGC